MKQALKQRLETSDARMSHPPELYEVRNANPDKVPDEPCETRYYAAIPLDAARGELRDRLLSSVSSESTLRSYGLALENLFAFAEGKPLTRAVLSDFRESMKSFSPSTTNVRLAAVRKLVMEAEHSGFLMRAEADDLAGVLKMRQKVTHLAKGLSEDQMQQILAVPDRTTLSGKRDYCILGLVLGCSLRRGDLADLLVDHVQEHDGGCFLRVPGIRGSTPRNIPVAVWVSEAIHDWQSAARVTAGKLIRVISPAGDVMEEGLSQQSAWEVVLGIGESAGVDSLDALDPRWFKVSRSSESRFNQVQSLLGSVNASETARWASGSGSVGFLGKLLDGAIHKLSQKYDELAAEEEHEHKRPARSKH